MAIFSNQATLTYNGSSTNSNIAYGEILNVLVATKTAVEETYTPGQIVTYVVTLRNTGTSALTGLTVTFNGEVWTEGVDYTYDEATGAFATLPCRITVPAATFTQNTSGVWVSEPGTAVLRVTGTV